MKTIGQPLKTPKTIGKMTYSSLLKRVSTRPKRFSQVEPENFVAFKCPDCEKHFGLTSDTVECIEANIHFNCPYCDSIHGIKT
jgi:hypothetical protein